MCYEESIKYAMQRKTFGKRLIDHQVTDKTTAHLMANSLLRHVT